MHLGASYHLRGIVVFADPNVEAPTCPRGYRAFGEWTEDPSDPSNSESASTGGSDDSTDELHSMKASTGGSTLSGEKSDALNESDWESADDRPTGPAPRSLGSFIAGFKSAATKRINDHRGTSGAAVWQRNYHDVIICTERHWRAARRYVRRNPAEWEGDRLNRNRGSNA